MTKPTPPILEQAVAGQKNKASTYNSNFNKMKTYVDDCMDYVDTELASAISTISTTSWYPIGSVFAVVCTSSYVPGGALPCDGTEYSSTQFSSLWTNYLTASTPKLQTCTYEEYTTAITTYGSCVKFGIDTTNNKFKVPTIKDGAYITQANSDNELGKSYNESLPNITGNLGWISLSDGSSTNGCFRNNGFHQWNISTISTSSVSDYAVDFDASRSSSTYQDDAKVQGDNVRLRYFVQVANGQLNESQMNWAAWASSLQGKINLDGSNISSATSTLKISVIDWFMPDYENGTSKISNTEYTSDEAGWLYVYNQVNSKNALNLEVWVGTQYFTSYNGTGQNDGDCLIVPIPNNTTYRFKTDSYSNTGIFYPCIGG